MKNSEQRNPCQIDKCERIMKGFCRHCSKYLCQSHLADHAIKFRLALMMNMPKLTRVARIRKSIEADNDDDNGGSCSSSPLQTPAGDINKQFFPISPSEPSTPTSPKVTKWPSESELQDVDIEEQFFPVSPSIPSTSSSLVDTFCHLSSNDCGIDTSSSLSDQFRLLKYRLCEIDYDTHLAVRNLHGSDFQENDHSNLIVKDEDEVFDDCEMTFAQHVQPRIINLLDPIKINRIMNPK